ncbi:MAG: hypothetical protein MJ153_08975 [Clostridia bacterium]|nr:hypothetical protein [Clostridia bacterium]
MFIKKEKIMIIGALLSFCFMTGCNSEPDKVIRGESSAESSLTEVTNSEVVTDTSAEIETPESSEIAVSESSSSETSVVSVEDVFTEEQLEKIEELISPKDYERFIYVAENGKLAVEENDLDRRITVSDSDDIFVIDISVDVIVSIQRGDIVLFTAY